ncbi:hypothetical protein [Paramagnetospirillum caucaseum]|uniref:hypothetical protein n=1 Tax=Paramagnetospirillum caucaseum TaxID=1244869 RepID=UPI0012682584|nr:hypothetical protein [Paramagnetospirillum caucaseum]
MQAALLSALTIMAILVGTSAANSKENVNGDLMVKLTKTIESAVGSGVKATLKDPGSAQLRYSTAFKSKELSSADMTITIVCGTVNAKNSFGGYVGERMFKATVATLKDTGKTFAIGPVSIQGNEPSEKFLRYHGRECVWRD